jgi:pantetheine-phosphate adenylyltransferase
LTTAIYPGTFDPITNGHLDIVARAARLFQKVIIAIYEHPQKQVLFSTEERVQLARESTAHLPSVEVESFSGLAVVFARKKHADVMVRGLRMTSDFEREFELAMMNKKLDPELDLVAFMANLRYQFLSSSLLKEAASLAGDINDLVPPPVAKALKKKGKSDLNPSLVKKGLGGTNG